MAKATFWLTQGTPIPSGHSQANLVGTGSDGKLLRDGWYEFTGTEAVIKSDYQLVTGYALENVPQESSSSIGAGNYFGGTVTPSGE